MVVSHRSQDFVDVFRKLSAESKATRHANAAFRAITLPATPMAHHDLKVSPDIFLLLPPPFLSMSYLIAVLRNGPRCFENG